MLFVAVDVGMVMWLVLMPVRWAAGMSNVLLGIGRVVSVLCVMGFNGPDHAARVLFLNRGVGFELVQERTGFPLLKVDNLGETPHPTAEQLAIIVRLDPHNLRARQLKGNPAGIRTAEEVRGDRKSVV